MLVQKRLATVFLTLGLLGNGAAMAADSGFYLGGSIGQARASFDSNPTLLPGIPTSFSTSSYAWKAYGGYQMNKYFGIELNYVNLGDYTVSAVVGAANLYTDIKVTGWGAALVGTIPLKNNWSLLGRVGETRLRESRGPCSTICAANTTFSADNTWSPSFGAGIKYDFNPNLSARGEVERFTRFGGNGNTFGGHATQYSAGLAYKF